MKSVSAFDSSEAHSIRDVLTGLQDEFGIEIGPVLGDGGFNLVVRGTQSDGTPSAIRISKTSLPSKNAQRELEALQLAKSEVIQDHRGIVSLLPERYQPPLPYRGHVVSLWELCAAGSLLDRLHECQSQGLPGIPAEEALGYLHDAAEAIDFLNRQGIFHRDIKPENLLLAQGHAKLADPSLLKFVGATMASHTGLGSLPYMPIEALVEGRHHETIDLFGLVGTYVMLRTGHFPHGDERSEIIANQRAGRIDTAGLKAWEIPFVERALASNPESRPEDGAMDFVDEMRVAARAVRKGLPGHLTAAVTPTKLLD